MSDKSSSSPEQVIARAFSSLTDMEIDLLLTEAPTTPEEIISAQKPNLASQFAIGICIGIRPDLAEPLIQKSYQKHILLNLLIYNHVLSEFHRQNIGFEVERTARTLQLMGLFPKEHINDFTEVYLKPVLTDIENRYHTHLCMGIGLPAVSEAQLKNSYKTAYYAFNLYFFEQTQIIDLQKINQTFDISLDDYDFYVDDAFRALLTKAPDVLKKIERVIEIIGNIHYGNWYAVRMRTMDYTGDLASRLRRYHLLDRDFFEMQDELQKNVMNAMTMTEIQQCIHNHYNKLLPAIYKSSRPSSKVIIERVKSYIQENFMEELSIQSLSEIACVSTNYFSHMFKNETGMNYKNYLTTIRLEKALELLMESDYKLYEICEKVGYKNVRTFVDAFKQRYSLSPINYKKSMMNKK